MVIASSVEKWDSLQKMEDKSNANILNRIMSNATAVSIFFQNKLRESVKQIRVEQESRGKQGTRMRALSDIGSDSGRGGWWILAGALAIVGAMRLGDGLGL